MRRLSLHTGPSRLVRAERTVPRYIAIVCLGALAAVSAFAQDHPLRAGAGRAEIVHPLYKGEQPPTGMFENEHLYARAVVVDNGTTRAVIIGIDQSNMPEAIWKNASARVAKDLDCPVANIVMSATHTHSPGLPVGPEDPPNPGSDTNNAQQRVADAIVSAVHIAKEHLQPAEMSYGTGSIDLNVNRDAVDPVTHLWTQAPNPQAPSDKTVAVLTFKTLAGVPIGIYVNYAMHAINGYLAGFASGDFPGAMSRHIENAYDDKVVAIFTQGASGDQNPLYLRPSTNAMASRYGAPVTGDEMVREDIEEPLRDGKVKDKPMDAKARRQLQMWMESEGEVLGELVIRTMTHATRLEKSATISGQQKEISCPGRVRTDALAYATSLTPYIIGMPGTYADGPPVSIRIGVLGIGDVAVASVDAELYTLIGQRLKRQSPMANTMLVTIANGRSTSGYIPDDASFAHNTFQVIASHLKIGCAETAISDGIDDMVATYLQGKR